MGGVALSVGLVAVARVFAPKAQGWAVGLGVVAINLGLVVQANTGSIGVILGVIAIALRFVLPKPEGGAGGLRQPTEPKPA